MPGDGARQDMATLECFHMLWSDLQIIPLAPHLAVASFQFRDSIVTLPGEVVQARGPTTFIRELRDGEWRVRFADADHYPVQP